MRGLGLDFLRPLVAKTVTTKHVPRSIHLEIAGYADIQEEKYNNLHRKIASGRCIISPKKKDKKPKCSCYKCDKFMCQNHMKLVCDSCLEGEKSG